MNIQGPSQIHGIQGVKGPHSSSRPTGPQSSKSAASPSDQVDISPAGEAAAQAVEGGEIRADLVARVRTEIANGTYETPEKLDAALEGLLNELG
jgi:negative regulator of flagellin synthesis FlgM